MSANQTTQTYLGLLNLNVGNFDVIYVNGVGYTGFTSGGIPFT